MNFFKRKDNYEKGRENYGEFHQSMQNAKVYYDHKRRVDVREWTHNGTTYCQIRVPGTNMWSCN